MNYLGVIVVWVVEHTALGLFPPCVLHTDTFCSFVDHTFKHLPVFCQQFLPVIQVNSCQVVTLLTHGNTAISLDNGSRDDILAPTAFVVYFAHVHLTLQGEGSYTFPPIYRGKKTEVVSFNVFNNLHPLFWLLFAILATTKL